MDDQSEETLEHLRIRATQARNLLCRRLMLSSYSFKPTSDIADAILGDFDEFLNCPGLMIADTDLVNLRGTIVGEVMTWYSEARHAIELYTLCRDGHWADATLLRLRRD